MDFKQLNELNAEVQSLKLALEQYTSQTTRTEATEFEQGFRAGVNFLGEKLRLNITEIERQVKQMLEEVDR